MRVSWQNFVVANVSASRPVFRLFSVFLKQILQLLQQINVRETSRMRCWDLNPLNFGRDSHPITTRPGLYYPRNALTPTWTRRRDILGIVTVSKSRRPENNKARTGPRSAARFCKILKLCNNFIVKNYCLEWHQGRILLSKIVP